MTRQAPCPWTPERTALLRRLWIGGVSLAHMGVALDLAPSSVQQAASRLRRQGVDLPRRPIGGLRPAWTPQRVALAAAAVRAGGTREQLAAALGVSAQSVRATVSWLRREGHLGEEAPRPP